MVRRKRHLRTTDPQTPADPIPAQTPRPHATSRFRAVLFRLLALLSPLLLLGTVNLVLFWLDVGYDTRVIVPVETSRDACTFCLNERASQAYYDEADLAGPDPRPFQIPAPADTYRIVVVGESSVEGFPYDTELAFARQIETFLGPQWPDRRIEVLNAGIVGINSFALVDFVPRMLDCQPDLVVLYTGHNEFYGPGGIGSSATLAPALYPVQTFLRRWRLYQSLRQLVRDDEPREALITKLPKDLEIVLDGPAFRHAEQCFRDHLVEISQAVERQNIPLLACSLACNLGDQSPVRSMSDPRLTAEQIASRDGWLKAGEEELHGGDHAAALQLFDKAAAIDDGYALIAYRRAQCLAATGQRERALELYRRARDLDGCRFRAPSSFREIIRQVATDTQRTRCYYLDLEGELERRSAKAAPGNDFFCEHVHFTFDGHREVARAIARSIVQQVAGRAWDEARVPTDDQVARAAGLTTFDHLMALGCALKIVHDEPYRSAPDAEQQYAFLTEQIKSYLRSLPGLEQITFAELDAGLRRSDLINSMAAALLARGDVSHALALFHTAQVRRPWEITSYVGAAKCLAALGKRDEARACIDQALQLAPDDPDLREIHEDLSHP